MECYLKDPDRSQHVFTFIRTLMEDGDLTDKEKEQLKTATLIHLTELVRVRAQVVPRSIRCCHLVVC